jgi:heptosyltransferase-2
MAIVVRSPNWIGDCIMSLPALRALREYLPGEDIYLAVKEYLVDIYRNVELIKDIIRIPNTPGFGNTLKAAGRLREFKFDSGILFTNSFQSALLFKLGGVKDSYGYNKDARGFLLKRKRRFPSESNLHHIYFYMNLVEMFLQEHGTGKIEKSFSDELPVSEEAKENAVTVMAELGVDVSTRNLFIGVSPSAAYGTAKQWLPERFAELIKILRVEMPNRPILLFGTSKEREKISGIINLTGLNDRNIHNLAGQLSLTQAIAAISLCGCFISNDSGLMHVASALRVPLAAIFGPTQPNKTAPLKEFNKNARVLYHGAECAPCLHRDCPIDHRCMTAVTVDEVLKALHSLPGMG